MRMLPSDAVSATAPVYASNRSTSPPCAIESNAAAVSSDVISAKVVAASRPKAVRASLYDEMPEQSHRRKYAWGENKNENGNEKSSVLPPRACLLFLLV